MGHTVKQCFDHLQERFKDIDFHIDIVSHHEQKNTVIIDKNILEDMAANPNAAKNYEQKISLMLELQKAFAQNKKESNKMVLLD